MKNIISFVFFSAFLLGCTTAGSKDVPFIKSEELPAIEMKTLSPKSIDLVVKNTRPVNQEAGNSKAIEDKVFSVIFESLAKSKIIVDPSAKTRLSIVVADYNHADDQGDCVQFEATCKVKKGTFTAKAFSCVQVKDAIFGDPMSGSISRAYQAGIKTLILSINEQAQQYDDWF